MELYCEAVEQAAATWQTVKQIPDYQAVVGDLLFRNIFQISPGAISLFSFKPDEIENGSVPDSIYQSPAFQVHARGVVQTLELVMGMMLGQDMTGLAEALHNLGSRHVQFGVIPAHYSIVETALLRTLGGALGDQWTDEVRKGWAAVFKFISKAMMSGAGEEPEIVKEGQHKKAESSSNKIMKCATMRLNLPESNASPSHTPDSRSRERRSHPRTRRNKSDPPRIMPRTRAKRKGHHRSLSADDDVVDFAITEIIFENSTVLDVDVDVSLIRTKPFRDDLSCDSSLSSRSSSNSNAGRLDEAPQRPIRRREDKNAGSGESCTPCRNFCSLPDIIVIESSRQDLEIRNKRSDLAPKMPRRRPPESDEGIVPFSLCKLQAEGSTSPFDAETVATTVSYKDENFRSAYWREEVVKVIYEV